MRVPSPRRFSPAAARMIAPYCPSSSLRSRVCTLPRNDSIVSCRIALAQLRLASQARRADDGAGRQRRQRIVTVGDERIARILARGNRREHEAVGKVHRHVLQRMDGEVGASFAHRGFELLDEQSLAADGGERPVDHAIALRRDAEQVHARAGMACDQLRANMLRLPQAPARIRAWRSSAGAAQRVPSLRAEMRHAGGIDRIHQIANHGGGGHISTRAFAFAAGGPAPGMRDAAKLQLGARARRSGPAARCSVLVGRPAARRGARLLAGDGDDRRVVGLGVVQFVQQVDCARARCSDADPDLCAPGPKVGTGRLTRFRIPRDEASAPQTSARSTPAVS